MTVSSTTRKAGPFAGNGATVSFPFAFKVFSGADVLVVRADATGAETTLALTTDYTVSLNADQNASPGGTVTPVVVLAVGLSLTLSSALDYLQPVDLTNNGGFYPAVVNTALDRLTILCQQLAERVSRSLKTAISTPAGVDPTLPAPVANNVLGWNSAGTAIINYVAQAGTSLIDLAASGGSSLIGFIQSGTGAVLRTVQGKQRDIISVRDFINTTIDGVTSNQAGIAAAVAYAYSIGAVLDWPAGTYVSDATIPNFHDVTHTGKGVLKRGADTWKISGNTGTNIIYLATTGSDANDGLTAALPKLTVQAGFNSLLNWTDALLRNGTFKLQLAAGTYAASSTLVGLRSKNRIQIAGPSVGGHPNVPTAIIDGNGLSQSIGMYLQAYIYADIQDIKFQNWTYGTTSAFGLVADGHCDVSLTNVHGYNCYYAAVSADNLTQIRMQGGIIDTCTFYGVRLYSQVSASIGYSGVAVGDSTIIQNCNTGIYGGVSSRVHVDYAKLYNNGVGLFVEKNTRAVANFTLFDTNTVAVRYDQNSIYGESGATNTFTANGKNYISYGSEDDVSAVQRFWDRTAQRTLYGATSYRSVAAKFEWQCGSASSGSSYNTNTNAVFDFNGGTSNWLGLSSPAASSVGLLASTVAKSAQGAWYYDFSSDAWRMWLNNQATTYLFNGSKFGPGQDNSKSLGESSFRWSVVYAGTGAINTSDEREKQQIQDVDAAAIRAVKNINFHQFKFNDAVQEKGDAARWHFGVIAQQVKAAFEAEGLDPFAYGVLCYDEWPETIEEWPEELDDAGNIIREAGRTVTPAGNRYGVRYDELLCLKLAALGN